MPSRPIVPLGFAASRTLQRPVPTLVGVDRPAPAGGTAQSARPFRWKRAVWVAAFALSLWLRTGYPIFAIGGAGADDALFVRLARSLALGQWLGPYDNLTLAKGMAYPLFIAAASLIGVPLKIAEQAVYLVVAGCASAYLGRCSGRRHLATVLFVALAFNPALWALPLSRVIREGLYVSLAFAVVTATVALCFHRGRLSSRLLLAAGAGLLLGAFWLTREEGPWIIPALACPVVVALVAATAQTGPASHRLRRLGQLGLSVGLGLLVFFACLETVMALNGRAYGEAVTTEFRSTAFARAYGALAGIRQDHWQRYIVFPRDARLRAYSVSPAVRELEPYFEGDGGRHWRRVGCDQSWIPMESCPEVLSGWFMWALRDAATATGQIATGRDARRFYTRLADEIDAACDRGALSCVSSRRATLAPPFHWQYLADMLEPAVTLGRIVFFLGGGEMTTVPSQGTPEQLATFHDLVGPIGPVASSLPQARPAAGERQALQHSVAEWLHGLYRVFAAVGFGLGLVAVGYATIRRLGYPLPLLAMTAAAAAAVACRIALLAYLDATSIPSANSLYASPASPFVITGAVLGYHAVIWTLRRRGAVAAGQAGSRGMADGSLQEAVLAKARFAAVKRADPSEPA